MDPEFIGASRFVHGILLSFDILIYNMANRHAGCIYYFCIPAETFYALFLTEFVFPGIINKGRRLENEKGNIENHGNDLRSLRKRR